MGMESATKTTRLSKMAKPYILEKWTGMFPSICKKTQGVHPKLPEARVEEYSTQIWLADCKHVTACLGKIKCRRCCINLKSISQLFLPWYSRKVKTKAASSIQKKFSVKATGMPSSCLIAIRRCSANGQSFKPLNLNAQHAGTNPPGDLIAASPRNLHRSYRKGAQ